MEAMSRLGKDPRVGMRLGTLLRAGGFVDVEETSFELPLCEWPTGQSREIQWRLA
jgi:hypothetical protein